MGHPRSLLAPVVVALVVLAVSCGCERPPVGPPGGGDPLPAGSAGPIDLLAFQQDRPVVGGKWYDYDPSAHGLAPKAQAWIVRDPVDDTTARFAAFRIVTVYDEDTGDSGLFTLSVATHDGAAWSAPHAWVASGNVKDGEICVDLFATTDGGPAGEGEAPCTATDTWQVRLAIQNRLSTAAGIAVVEPAVFFKSVAGTSAFGSVTAARIDDVTGLDALPDPSGLAQLDDAPAAWDTTDWAFDHLAPDLPEAGMAIGARFVDDGFVARPDVYFLMSGRFDLVRFTVVPVSDGDVDDGLRVSFSSVDVDRDTWSFPEELPEPTTVDVAAPAPGAATWLTFTSPTLLPDAADVEGASWPFSPAKAIRYDLAFARTDDGTPRLLVSPSAAVLNATQLGLDEALPPVDATPEESP
jgi:hypothetical protein